MAEALMPVEEFASEEVIGIFDKYIDWLGVKYGLKREHILWLGYNGNVLFEAEMSILGDRAYSTSVAVAIRNLYYSIAIMDTRAETLDTMQVKEPILDYGCGMGFMAMYLVSKGYINVWAYDVPGVQSDLAREFLVQHGVNWGIPESPGTVFCINVLEHMDKPGEFLKTLRSMGGQLYANCDTHTGAGHVATAEERQAVIADLKASGQWLDFMGEDTDEQLAGVSHD